MSIWEDLKEIEEQVPVVPAGDYNAVVVGAELDQVQTQNGDLRDVIRVQLVFQGNPNTFLTDNQTPVDGQSAEYTIFLPSEQDKTIPAKFGRGTMYDVSLRRLKRFFKAVGVNPENYNSLEEALEQVKDAQVIVSVSNTTSEDGTIYDRVSAIK